MSLVERASALAERMMAKHATEAILVRVEGSVDPRTDRRSKHEVNVDCHAVLSNRRTGSSNGLVTTQLIAKLTKAPKGGDKLLIGCATHNVAEVEEIAPHGDAFLWIAVLR